MKNILRISLIVIVLGSVMLLARSFLATELAQAADNKNSSTEVCKATNSCEPLSHKVVAYYFHGDARCTGCRRIEAWSEEAIKGNFQKELDSGKLEWKVINVDEAANEHFNDDYQLYTKSLVIVDFQDAKQSKWKNLKDIWNYLSDKEEFSKYVSYEVGEYLKEK